MTNRQQIERGMDGFEGEIEDLESRLAEANKRADDAEADLAETESERNRASQAIEWCLRTSNGRESEWGERAVAAIGFLHEFSIEKRKPRSGLKNAT